MVDLAQKIEPLAIINYRFKNLKKKNGKTEN